MKWTARCNFLTVWCIAGVLCTCAKEPTSKSSAVGKPTLEFALAANPAHLNELQIHELRHNLSVGKYSSNEHRLLWAEIHDINLWTEVRDELDAIAKDSFAVYLPSGRIVDRYDGRMYLLVYDQILSPQPLEILSISKAETSLGYPAIHVELNDQSKSRLQDMVGSGNSKWVAVMWNGKVLSTAFEEPWLRFNNFSIGRRERDRLIHQLN